MITGAAGESPNGPHWFKLLARLYDPDEAHITVLEQRDGRGGLI
jgi:hypothetical protein